MPRRPSPKTRVPESASCGCGKHRVLYGRCNPVGRCRAPPCRTQAGMVADPPSAIELDSEWRDRAGFERPRSIGAPLHEVQDQGLTMP